MLFSFQGRIGRRDWWVFSILIAVAYYIASALPLALLLFRLNISILVFYALGPAIGLLFTWPFAALSAKRLHDQNQSAWWLIGPLGLLIVSQALVAGVMLGYSGLFDNPQLDGLVWPAVVCAMVGLVWAIVHFGLMPGSPEQNRFGPSPVAATPSA